MTPTTIIHEAQSEGVRLALSPTGTIKASGDPAAVNRWLPLIREHKAEIVALLSAANDAKVGAGETVVTAKRGRWLIHYADRDPVEVHCTPPASHAEVLSIRPDAIAAEPISEQPKRMESLTAADRELLRLWFESVGGDDPADLADLIETCRSDADALVYYLRRAMDKDIHVESDDDRRTCSQCSNLRGQTCAAAVNLGASRSYRPALMVLHLGRCLEYLPGPIDYDRSTGRERWAGLAAMEPNTTYRKDWK